MKYSFSSRLLSKVAYKVIEFKEFTFLGSYFIQTEVLTRSKSGFIF